MKGYDYSIAPEINSRTSARSLLVEMLDVCITTSQVLWL